jgi:DNA-binding GntR family transcriptional regulator
VPEIEVRSITEQVVEAIRDGIRSGRFPPGSAYSVQTFADILKVSRTPVREALVRLAEIGMVRFERNRGITILRPDVRDLEEIFQLRLLLEVPAAGRAARRITDAALERLRGEIDAMGKAVEKNDFIDFLDHDVAFHEIVIEQTGNRRQRDMVRNLRDATRSLGGTQLLQDATRPQDRSAFGLPQNLADVLREHVPILLALEARDPQAAASAMYEHVLDTGRLLMAQLAEAEAPGTFNPDWAEGIPVPNYRAKATK